MKIIMLLIVILSGLISYADELRVEVNPNKPVAGEVFQAYFRIFTESDEVPAINFVPSGIEVVGKSNQGISTRTIYANGKLTVTREITVVYELMAPRPGLAYMRDINVQIGQKNLRHSSVSLSVLKEAEELAEVFVMADASKKELYVGEGVVVRYYLYSKVPVSNLDIKRYPKLNKFLKRFLQEPERTERVSVDGSIYMRTQIYAAKLFPEKTGELNIDPLYLSATYPRMRAGDPFGGLGLNREFRTKEMSSEAIKIRVNPLPEPIPSHFTGLVGTHDFQLQVGKNKLIVNEPLEIKLTVTGNGALENLEAPTLIGHPGLEEFESNGDLKISDANQATKIFDYTFLAKENFELPPKVMTLSYLNPESGKYVPVNLNFPEIVVAGEKATATKVESQETPKVEKPAVTKPTKTKELLPPIVSQKSYWKLWLPYINLVLALIAMFASLIWLIKQNKMEKLFHFGESGIPSIFKKGKFDLSEFIRWISPLIEETGKSPNEIIRHSPLADETKKYFEELLTMNNYKTYSLSKSSMEFKYQSNHFKRLKDYIESATHERSS